MRFLFIWIAANINNAKKVNNNNKNMRKNYMGNE